MSDPSDDPPGDHSGDPSPPAGGPRLPRGELLRSRVVPDPGALLEGALDRHLTGYAAVVPGDTLLLDERGRGLLTFEDGVPVVAYHERTGRGGEAALADLARGPWRVELSACDGAALADTHAVEAWRVPPAVPAERVAGAPDLAERTRRRAPDDRRDAGRDLEAVEAFLDDTERIEAVQAEARAEAEQRAAEWGFDGQLADR
jgi:hypothetical protein